ncbi:hypothetical protein, variant, partial [Sphaeroforma arctica JP610]
VFVFETFGINYATALGIRPDQVLKWDEIATGSMTGLIILGVALGVFSTAVEPGTPLEDTIPVFTLGLLMYMFLTKRHVYYHHARKWIHGILYKCIFPGARISFAEVFIADGLTSLSKVFADFEQIFCFVGYHVHQWDVYDASPGCMSSLFLPIVVSIPYTIRLRQCLIEYRAAGVQKDLVNAFKYASAYPPIWLGHALKMAPTGQSPTLYSAWILASVVNTMYTYYWDLVWDWGLFDRTSPNYPLRARMMLPRPLYYMWILIDLILRCVWSVQLSNLLRLNSADKIILFELLEIIRRALWNIVRVEYECIKTDLHHDKNGDLPRSSYAPNIPSLGAKRVGSTNGSFNSVEMTEVPL